MNNTDKTSNKGIKLKFPMEASVYYKEIERR